jgi:hypothetical protein
MTTVSYTPNQTATLKDTVNRILNECGIPAQANLVTSQYLGTVTAINAVNDAINDIKFRNRWEWLKATVVLDLQVGNLSYTPPDDFVRMAHPFTPWNGVTLGRSLQELTPDEYWQMIPSSGTMTPGTPYCYMVDSNVINLWPTPNADFIALWPQLLYTYFKGPARPLGAADQALAIDVPPEFTEAVVAFGKWKIKLMLEFPDWQAEQARYEQVIRVQMNRNNAGRKAPRLRTTFPSNQVW